VLLAQRALTDTGVMAREVLGYDYDKDEDTGKVVRPGGLRPTGPHQQMIDFFDGDARNKHIEAPRGSYKSTAAMSFCIRKVIANPDLRVIYGMETLDLAKKKLRAIKEHFEGVRIKGESETTSKLVDTYGDLSTTLWNDDEFTIAGRSMVIDGASFRPLGVDSKFAGSHGDIFILDDLVAHQNVKTAEGIQKVKDTFEMIEPLADPGAIIIVIGTRYHGEDYYGHLLRELADEFEVLILDCGMDLEKTEQSQYYLTGQPNFAHLTEDFLKRKLVKMGSAKFSSQYLNRIMAGGSQLFTRSQFKHCKWDPWMRHLSTYVLTDTATSEREEGCYSVVACVGIDSQNRAYLLDLRVGHWLPSEFVSQFFDVLEIWNRKTVMKGDVWEEVSLVRVFRTMIEEEARKRQVRLNTIDVKRGANDLSKHQRIQSLQGRFENGNFIVVDTVPTNFHDLGEERLLFDPEGVAGEGETRLPDGELVREFIFFPKYAKKDIADALADIDYYDRKGQRVCRGADIKRAQKEEEERGGKHRGDMVFLDTTLDGVKAMVAIGHNGGSDGKYDTSKHWRGLAARAGA